MGIRVRDEVPEDERDPDLIRVFGLHNLGMTMAMPPESVDRLIGGQSGYTAAQLDLQWRLPLVVRPTFRCLKPMGSDWNPLPLGRMKHWLSLYKEFICPFQSTSRIYYHAPVAAGPEPQGWGVLELASVDRTRAICGLFQLGNPWHRIPAVAARVGRGPALSRHVGQLLPDIRSRRLHADERGRYGAA